jgi:hypothetical protein
MAELPVKEVRPAELHLPEIKREQIVRALSGIRLPEIDLPRVERPSFGRPSRSVERILTGIAVALHLLPRARRPRWPLAVGGLIVAGVVAAILSNATVRARLASGATTVRDRMTAMRPSDPAQLEIGPDDAVAFDAAEAAKVQASPFTEATPIEATDYPAGLGADQENGNQVPEEATALD